MIRKSQASKAHQYRLLAGVALASLFAVISPLLAEDNKAEIQLSEFSASEFSLPALPEVETAVERDLAGIVRIDDAAPVPAETSRATALISQPEQPLTTALQPETKLDLPELPDVVVAVEPLQAPQPADPVIAAAPVEIAPPDLPAVAVSIEVPAEVRPLDTAALRSHLEAERVRLKLRPGIIEGILAAYAGQGGKPAWISGDGSLSPAVSPLRDLLARADQHGLDPQRLLSALPALPKGRIDEAAREKVDAALSLAALLYAHDARGGRLEPTRLSNLLTPSLTLPVASELLPRLWQAGPENLAGMLEAYQPAHPGYRALKTRLAALRAELADPVITSAITPRTDSPLHGLAKTFMEGGLLLPGKSDPRVPALRIRLNVPAQDDTRYDAPLVEAVKAFQRANGLTANGRITPKTREILEDIAAPLTLADRKADPREVIANLQANMERWRWLPSELGAIHIFVNVPEYRLDMMSGGASVFNTRVIVGKPDTQTPIFSDAMDFLVVNPSWHVPPSILKNEFIPRLAADPEYASKRGYEVTRRGNSISVRQPPGDRNALGHVKFMFPNQHSVYLHDTPTRQLFHNATRAYSHGCVRVEGPFKLAEQILLAKQGFTEKSLRAMVGHGERTIRLSEKIPVHLTYFTLGVDANGALVSRADIYGHDARIRKALAL